MYKHRQKVFEKISDVRHPEFEIKETRVSDYLRRYGTGKVEDMLTSSAPEVTDNRSEEEMLNSEFEPSMATETIDILMEIEKNKDRFQSAIDELQLTASQKKQFQDAVAVLDNPNSDLEAKQEAYSILNELETNGKLTRARKS